MKHIKKFNESFLPSIFNKKEIDNLIEKLKHLKENDIYPMWTPSKGAIYKFKIDNIDYTVEYNKDVCLYKNEKLSLYKREKPFLKNGKAIEIFDICADITKDKKVPNYGKSPWGKSRKVNNEEGNLNDEL